MENPDEAMKGLGKLQREILLWLGEQEGLTTPRDLRNRWPPTVTSQNPQYYELKAQLEALKGEMPSISSSITNALFARSEEFQRLIENLGSLPISDSYPLQQRAIHKLEKELTELSEHQTEELPHARYVKDEYFETPKHLQPKGVAWRAEYFLGRQASKSESAKIATSLKKLEERRLVKLHKSKGKQQKTSHVELTRTGAIVSVKIRSQQ